MNNLVIFIIFFTTLTFTPAKLMATEDTTENRLHEANRYLLANPPEEIFRDIASRVKDSLPAEEQSPFIEMLTKHLDIEALADAMRTSMVKNFTTQEIATLADFYSMPAAKSAMNKMGLYMSEVLPVVQAEMLKAQEKAFSTSHQTELKPAE